MRGGGEAGAARRAAGDHRREPCPRRPARHGARRRLRPADRGRAAALLQGSAGSSTAAPASAASPMASASSSPCPTTGTAASSSRAAAGLNGTVSPALGAAAAGDRPALARGFAIVSTDSGHQGAVFDSSFMADQQAALDFAHASLGAVTRVARKLVAAYYGRAPAHSYMVGCSTGGARGDAGGRALSRSVRRHRRGLAGDAHRQFEHRHRLCRGRHQPGGAARRVRPAHARPGLLGGRQGAGAQGAARRLRRAGRPHGRP